jgi:hypothetical protein
LPCRRATISGVGSSTGSSRSNSRKSCKCPTWRAP